MTTKPFTAKTTRTKTPLDRAIVAAVAAMLALNLAALAQQHNTAVPTLQTAAASTAAARGA